MDVVGHSDSLAGANRMADALYNRIGANGRGIRGEINLVEHQKAGGFHDPTKPGRFFLTGLTLEYLGVRADGSNAGIGDEGAAMRVFAHETNHDVVPGQTDRQIPNAPAHVGALDPGEVRGQLAYHASGAEYYARHFPEPLRNNDNLICIYVGC